VLVLVLGQAVVVLEPQTRTLTQTLDQEFSSTAGMEAMTCGPPWWPPPQQAHLRQAHLRLGHKP
jgi:hypothetical protein